MSVIILPKAQIEYGEIYGMAQRQQEIEAFVQHLVVEVEAAGAVGMIAPQAITDHFNAKGATTRKGRRSNGATVAKFLNSRAPSAAVRVENLDCPAVGICGGLDGVLNIVRKAQWAKVSRLSQTLPRSDHGLNHRWLYVRTQLLAKDGQRQ